MSSSSRPERRRPPDGTTGHVGGRTRGRDGRAQVEPTAAIAAGLVVGLALAAVGGAFARAQPAPTDPNDAELTIERVHEAVSEAGAVLPRRLSTDECPASHGCNVSLSVGRQRWAVGDDPGATPATASRHVSVAVGPGRRRVGRLRVVVWR